MADFEDIVSQVTEWFHTSNKRLKKEFLSCKEKDLISYHTSLGRSIRNEFKLWENTWTPEIINGVDHSENHPDAISMNVIKEVWKRLQDENLQRSS